MGSAGARAFGAWPKLGSLKTKYHWLCGRDLHHARWCPWLGVINGRSPRFALACVPPLDWWALMLVAWQSTRTGRGTPHRRQQPLSVLRREREGNHDSKRNKTERMNLPLRPSEDMFYLWSFLTGKVFLVAQFETVFARPRVQHPSAITLGLGSRTFQEPGETPLNSLKLKSTGRELKGRKQREQRRGHHRRGRKW